MDSFDNLAMFVVVYSIWFPNELMYSECPSSVLLKHRIL